MKFGDAQIESLEATHPLYEEHMEAWEQLQDCFDGETAIKKKGTVYLPRLYGMASGQYAGFLSRAYFYNATRRVCLGSVGMLLSNAPILHQNEEMAKEESVMEWYDSLASDNSEFYELIKRVATEYVLKGRVGILVDGELLDGKFVPKLLRYPAEKIRNWDYDMIQEGRNKTYKLRWVVLEEETFAPTDETPWVREEETQYRVLWLDADGIYNMAVYKEIPDENADKMVIGEDAEKKKQYALVAGSHIQPTQKGRPMNFVPFYVINYGGDSASVTPPPLKELSDMNISHYKTVALHENAVMYAGVPTVIFTGVQSQSIGDIQLGLGEAVTLEEETANVHWLELSGTALGSLEKSMDAKEIKMGLLGSRMLLPEPERGNESTATQRMRRKGEHAVISSMSDMLTAKFTEIVRFAAEWAGRPNPKQYKVQLVKEMAALTPDSNLIMTFMQLAEKKFISFESFMDLMVKMEILPGNTDVKEEIRKIDSGLGSDIIAELALASQTSVEKIEVNESNTNKPNRPGG